MSIGILYESDEWSNQSLKRHLDISGIETENIFIEDFIIDPGRQPEHKLYVNRVFPSALKRKNQSSVNLALNFYKILNDAGIPLINSFNSFLYDCNKINIYYELFNRNFPVPRTIHINPARLNQIQNDFPFPAVLKPNRGGRSWNVKILERREELSDPLPDISGDIWILQEFVPLEKGFTTRVETLGNEIMTVLKRHGGMNGVSGYSRGSRYEIFTDCGKDILDVSLKITEALDIEMGSLDIIELKNGEFFVIDVNATSNFTPDYLPLLGFDPILKMAEFIADKYKQNEKKEMGNV